MSRLPRPLHSRLRSAPLEMTECAIGMETRITRGKLANTTQLIFTPEPYPCYPPEMADSLLTPVSPAKGLRLLRQIDIKPAFWEYGSR